MFLDNGYVGIASEKAHRVNITLARTAQNDCYPKPPIVSDQYSARVMVVLIAVIIGPALRTRWQNIVIENFTGS